MSDFVKYANSFQTVYDLGLGRIAALLGLMGDPQRGMRFVHVAGTNGKGSVCAMLDAVFTASGLRVGRYTSPNLIRVNERIAVCGEDIPDGELEPLLERVGGFCGEVKRMTGKRPTQFEVWTAAAMEYFKRRNCDVAILEVGLGGEFDATNVIEKSEISVITRIALDHCEYLGSTLAEVAAAKCGIMKKGGRTVALLQEPEVNAVIEERAALAGNSLTFAAAPESLGHEGMCERFAYKGMELKCALGGPHQIENAAIAAETALRLGMGEGSIRQGLASARHRGRLEEAAENLIFDGAHNPNGVAALAKALDRYFPGRERTVVFACMRDKDAASSLKLLNSPNTKFIFTRVESNPRSMQAEELAALARELGIAGECAENLSAALKKAEKGRLTVVCGSLYLYEALPAALKNFPQNP